MKFQVAFVLLAIFGAAQAGKEDVMTFGSGYDERSEEPCDSDENEIANIGDEPGALASEMLNPSTSNAQQAKDLFAMKSEVYTAEAQSMQDLCREKREMSVTYAHRAKNLAHHANEAYKNAQLNKRLAKEKEVIAKEYQQKAEKHDRASKQQDMKGGDSQRKELAELDQHCDDQKRANTAAVLANGYAAMSQMEWDETNECEQHARALMARSEELEKMACQYKEKAKKEKELARIEEEKSKEYCLNFEELLKCLSEANKKEYALKYYLLEFSMKAEHECCNAEYANIRSHFMKRLQQEYRDHAEILNRYAQTQHKNHILFKKRAIETSNESRMLAKSATELLKRHRSYDTEIYSKDKYHEM